MPANGHDLAGCLKGPAALDCAVHHVRWGTKGGTKTSAVMQINLAEPVLTFGAS
jgi:hypothetical protein